MYGVSKTAMLGLAKALAAELGPQGIRVNSLCPGLVRTRFASNLWKDDNILSVTNRERPLGRVADPIEMAGPVAFLVSDDSRYMTGEAIVVAGGRTMGRL
eukprot:NODE_25322_length_591_cov_4.232759.p2 GENE.NODE_25322_length_591_cov_4.232759~~NODE_25322_length_591_cov_4.232759.p2  ORF type:complete len:100 (-),score=15.39 NODE_25322_length_591_cov_4.232759:150-449(-)